MTASAHSTRQLPIARFGLYDLNLGTRELLHKGVRIKLQDQPFQILEHLVEQAPNIVSRDDLQRRLWDDGTFVDFDHSLNTAIKKLRQALDDDAENPRFIETLPRRGYRFIAPVQWIGSRDNELALPRPIVAEPGRERQKRRVPRRWWVAVASVLLALAGYVALRSGRPTPATAAEPNYTVIPLTSYPGIEEYGALSPDGDKVVFAWDQGQNVGTHVFVKQIGSEQPLQLTSGDGTETAPVWSPDGKYIAFVRASEVINDTTPIVDVYIMSSLGGGEHKVATIHLESKFGAYVYPTMSWSPDGTQLAVPERAPGTGNIALFVLSLDTLQKRQLTFPSEYLTGDSIPAFSPDGKTIAFARTGKEASDVFTVPTSGGTPTRITNENHVLLDGIAWTANGESIVYSGFGIRAVSKHGGPSRLVLPTSITGSLSIVGKRLVYSEYAFEENIYSAALNGTKVASAWQKVLASTRTEEGPRFSPDGKRVAFQSTRSGNIEIWVSAADGTNPIRLTNYSGPLTGSPRWSPDGETIVYDSRPYGNADIFAVSPDGGQPRQLTRDTTDEVMPSYSHDGRWIYFASNRSSGMWSVWKMPSAGGAAIRLTQGEGFTPIESPDGKYVYYARGPAHSGLYRVPVEGGTEEEILPDLQPTLYGYWTVTSTGILFAQVHEVRTSTDTQPLTATQKHPTNRNLFATLEFYSFATKKKTRVAELPYLPFTWAPGLEISPDGKRVMMVLTPNQGADLHLVENFR